MASPSAVDVILQYLLDRGHVFLASSGAEDWWGQYDLEPAEGPDNVVTIFDLGSELAGRVQTSGDYADYPQFQVRIRSRDYAQGEAKGKAIQKDLVRLGGVTVAVPNFDPVILHSVRLKTPLVRIGPPQDKNQRVVFVLDAFATIRSVPA